MIEKLRDKAKELLKSKQVELVIGYKRASDGVSAAPCFIDREDEAGQLIWDAYCVYNLANYLKEFPGKKVAIIAKPCDVKSIAVLLQENQLKRDNLFILGLKCQGVIDQKSLNPVDKQSPQAVILSAKCKACNTPEPLIYDILFEDKDQKGKIAQEKDEYEPVRKLEAKSLKERLKLWEGEFSRCIRCYACRQVCPMCYCPKCVADQAMPGWFSKGTSLRGNFSWNVVRAMHLAGRCIDCGQCQRACPVGISLGDINKKIEKDVLELFNYQAGLNIEEKPLLSTFDKNDPDKFIK